MARTVDEQEYANRERAILDTLQRLVFSKGYERLTINDIRMELGISSGALFHYFKSKQAMLEALVERMQQEAETVFRKVVDNQERNAIEKLQGFFDALDRLRSEHKEVVLSLLRGWYTDENAIVRQKIADRTIQARAPLLGAIIRQGVAEGLFECAEPALTAELILALTQGMEAAHARTLLSLEPSKQADETVASIIAMHSATMEAIERVLLIQKGTLRRIDFRAISRWLDPAATGSQ